MGGGALEAVPHGYRGMTEYVYVHKMADFKSASDT